jgi:hypothetical protein
MKQSLLIGSLALLTSAALGADAANEIKGAAKKLADSGNYSWTTTTEFGGAGGGAGRMRTGPTQGKLAKDGVIHLSMTFGDNTTEAVIKGEQGAVRTQEGWRSFAEASEGGGGGGGGQPNAGRWMARMLQDYKAPAVEAGELAGRLKGLKKDGETFTGELTEEGARALMTLGRRGGGGAGPEVSGPKGTAKFWVKDGVLTKYEYRVQGTMTFNNNDREVDRLTTVEIKDVGRTEVQVPEEARKKLS